MKDVIIIAGPTAVGKTNISIKLAKKLNTEIISADSMQIYKGMDIGTAKITEEEKQGIVHHLIDIVEPIDNFSVHDFQRMALEKIETILRKNKTPIIVGGTGLYIDSLIYEYDFLNVKPDYELRERLEKQYNQNPNILLNRVHNISKNYSNLTVKDMKKTIRAIEVFEKTGQILNYNRIKTNTEYKYHLYVLNDNREALYNRINNRVDIMIDNGLLNEVKSLNKNGLNENYQSMKAIGYREVLSYFNGEINYDEMIEKLKQNSRNYAKRQITWFRRNEFTNWLDVSKYSQDEIVDYIIDDIFNK